MATTIARRPAIRLAATTTLTAAMAVIAALIAITLPDSPISSTGLTLGLGWIIVIAVACELAAIDRPIDGHTHTLSLSEVGLVIGLAFCAPVTLIVGRVIAGIIVYGAIRRIPTAKLGFNTALFALETAAAATTYHLLIADRALTDPAAWAIMLLALTAATTIGLGAVRLILHIHHSPQRRSVAWFSLAITGGATAIGITATVALTTETEAAILIIILTGFALLAIRTINTLLNRLPDLS